MEGTDDERYTSATAGMDFSHKLTDTLAVTMKTAAGMDIDDSDNWTLKSEAALASTLTKNLSLIVSVTHAYDNDPPPGVKENDVTVMTALGFAF
jgi:putative salt-induced outer membrane protein YdiY